MAQLLDLTCLGDANFQGQRIDCSGELYIQGNQIGSLREMYPVGAVYFTTNDSMPTIFGNMGSWTPMGTITIGSYTVRGFKRTA